MSKSKKILFAVLAVAILAALLLYFVAFREKDTRPYAGITIYYTTPSGLDAFGNFNFQYPARFIIECGGLECEGAAGRHAVVLVEREEYLIVVGEDGEITEREPARIEINVETGENACAAYAACAVAEGVAIGTKSADPEVASAVKSIAKKFSL